MTRTVIVGAGAAGVACARELRLLDAERAITLLDKDPDVPYERPPLSKALSGTGARSAGTGDLLEAGVALKIGTALRVDTDARVLHTSQGDIGYDDLVLAPGSRPHRPEWAGDQVHVLHSLADSRRLRRSVSSARTAVVVGGGLVGAELAASLASAGVQTTLVFRDSALFRRRLGSAASDLLSRLHAEAGVRLIPGASVAGVQPGSPAELHLADGTAVEADLIVAGVGSRPDTDWLRDTGLLDADGAIGADGSLNTRAPHVKAAGDGVRWGSAGGSGTRSAHWTTARAHGRHIAKDLAAGTDTPFGDAPYFWSTQHGNLVQVIGHVDPQLSVADVVPAGGSKPGLLVRYVTDGALVGAVAVNHPQGLAAARADLERHHAVSAPVG